MRKHPISSRQHTLAAGAACILLGSWLLWDAYEGRGVERPFIVKFLPGV